MPLRLQEYVGRSDYPAFMRNTKPSHEAGSGRKPPDNA
jgi:hypothetical protein